MLQDGPIELVYYTMDLWNKTLKTDLEALKDEKYVFVLLNFN